MKRILIPMCAFAVILVAQGPPERMGPRQGAGNEALKNVLGLDDNQIQQLVDLRQSTAESLQPVREQMREQQQALRALREAGNTDPAQVGQIVQQIEALREQARAAHDQGHEQAVNLMNSWGLGPQLEELQAAAALIPAIGPAQRLGLLDAPEGLGMGGPRAGQGPGSGRRGGFRRGPGPGGPPPEN